MKYPKLSLPLNLLCLRAGGSLLSKLRKEGTSIALHEHVRFCVEAARGLRYLEKMKCIHRDVAARNWCIAKYILCSFQPSITKFQFDW